MTRQLRASSETPPEIIGPEANQGGVDTQLDAPALTDCERKILELRSGPFASVFDNPQEWDAVTLPGASFGIASVLEDGQLVIAAAWTDPPDADYLTRDLNWWQERCLRDDACLYDGSSIRLAYHPMA